MLKRVQNFLLDQLRQGTSPQALALTIAVGAAIAIFPTLGATTLLCVLAGLVLKLNQPLLQVINYTLAPLQLLMIPVFLKMGAWICRVPAVSVNPQTMIAEFWSDPGTFMVHYGWAGLQAILAWIVVAPFVIMITRLVMKRLIEKTQSLRSPK